MTAATAPPRILLGQRVDGLNGLRLAVFQRYADLLEHLRPLEAASHSAFLDGDLRLFRRYHSCHRDRLLAVETWMERACRLLRIKGIDDVLEALDEEAKRDAIVKDIFAMLRAAHQKADAAVAEPKAAAAAAADGAGTRKYFSQNEIREVSQPDPAQTEPPRDAAALAEPAAVPMAKTASAAGPDIGPRDAGSGSRGSAFEAPPDAARSVATTQRSTPCTPRDAPQPPQAPSKTIPQNEMARPRRLQMRGAGSWSEPRLLPPNIIMGREVYPREPDWRNGEYLFE